MRTLITSALPYVNNIPHLGNIIGCVLSADVYARYKRLNKDDVLFVCGTDEYGTATETKAKEQNVTPREICNKYHKIHKEIYDWFNISFDIFGRTSCENPSDTNWSQTKLCHDIFNKLVDNNLIYEKEIEQLYSEDLNKFCADRYIKGTCPSCKFVDANGDQCDMCGKLHSATELIDPYYKLNPEFKLVKKRTLHLFLKLSELKNELKEWYDSNDGSWTNIAAGITKSWLNDDLHDRCITRDLEWGTPVPDTKKFGNKFKNKVFYVWFDAPIGYISITANKLDTWADWWKNKDVKLINFMAKDNVPFHSIIFPACLIGTRDNYNLVNTIAAVDYLNYEDKKFSKSNNIGVFGDDAKKSGLCTDIWRFYLVRVRPETNDSFFTWSDFEAKINSELVNNFSNLVNRILVLTYKYFKVIPEIKDMKLYEELNSEYNHFLDSYKSNMNKIRLREGLINFIKFSSECNMFINIYEPWSLIKSDREKTGQVLGVLCNFLIKLSVLGLPFIPDSCNKIQNILNIKCDEYEFNINQFVGSTLNKPEILFKRVSQDKLDELKSKFN